MVELIIPPTMGAAIGFITSAPIPFAQGCDVNEYDRAIAVRKVQVRVNWSFREESSSASQKAPCGDHIFRGLSPPVSASARDGQPVYLLRRQGDQLGEERCPRNLH